MVSQVTVILTRQDAVTSVCIVLFNQCCLLPVTVTAFLLLIFSTANIFVTRTCRMHTKRNMQVVSLFATELRIYVQRLKLDLVLFVTCSQRVLYSSTSAQFGLCTVRSADNP